MTNSPVVSLQCLGETVKTAITVSITGVEADNFAAAAGARNYSGHCTNELFAIVRVVGAERHDRHSW